MDKKYYEIVTCELNKHIYTEWGACRYVEEKLEDESKSN